MTDVRIDDSGLPRIVVVGGPPGSGKTTLAHAIAEAFPCPAICRDEIKEGLAHGRPEERPALGDPLSAETYTAFFDVVRLLLRHGVTHVAEAAFQHELWAPEIEPLLETADVRLVRCEVDPGVARDRILRRLREAPTRRAAHADDAFLAMVEQGSYAFEDFDHLTLDAPTITVDTTEGYQPALDEILAFIHRPGRVAP